MPSYKVIAKIKKQKCHGENLAHSAFDSAGSQKHVVRGNSCALAAFPGVVLELASSSLTKSSLTKSLLCGNLTIQLLLEVWLKLRQFSPTSPPPFLLFSTFLHLIRGEINRREGIWLLAFSLIFPKEVFARCIHIGSSCVRNSNYDSL